MKNKIEVSIIIPFYGKCSILKETLSSLNKQSDKNFEVILIDDESPDSAEKLALDYKNEINLSYHRIVNKGRSGARNFGINLANSDYLIFLDADMLVEEDWIKKIKQHINLHPNSVLVVEGYRNPKHAITSFYKYIIAIEKTWKTSNLNSYKIDYKNFKFTACNLLFPKNKIIELKGFNEIFIDGEDFDLGIRTLNNNIDIFSDPSIISYHNDWPTLSNFIMRQNQYNKGVFNLIKYHPEYTQYFPNSKTTPLDLIKKKITSLLSIIINPITLNESFILEYLPYKISFFFYRLTISSLIKQIDEN